MERGEYFGGQRSVKILGHLVHATIEVQRTPGPPCLEGDQAGNGHTGARNRNLLPCRHALQEPLQVSLCVMNVHFHDRDMSVRQTIHTF
jgi:hypothetical protein